MNPKKNLGILLWLSVCLSGSIVFGLIFTKWFNSMENLDNLDLFESLFVIFVLLVLSLVFSIPLLLYVTIREKLNVHFQSRVLEYNLIYTSYCIALFFIFSCQMVSVIEGLQLMLTYFITGLIALNIYLRKINITTQNRRNGH